METDLKDIKKPVEELIAQAMLLRNQKDKLKKLVIEKETLEKENQAIVDLITILEVDVSSARKSTNIAKDKFKRFLDYDKFLMKYAMTSVIAYVALIPIVTIGVYDLLLPFMEAMELQAYIVGGLFASGGFAVICFEKETRSKRREHNENNKDDLLNKVLKEENELYINISNCKKMRAKNLKTDLQLEVVENQISDCIKTIGNSDSKKDKLLEEVDDKLLQKDELLVTNTTESIQGPILCKKL